jgi:hypothetical protein
MATLYPEKIDTQLSLPQVFDGISPVMAADVNRLRDAIVAIQNELGTNPSSVWGTLKDRLDNIFSDFFASDVMVTNYDGYYSAGPDGYLTIQEALDQIGAAIQALSGGLGNIAASQATIVDADGYFDSTNVEDALTEIMVLITGILSNTGVAIGTAEDGDYTDGLFEDFTPSTFVGTAIDRFNEVLKRLAPPPAPALSTISWTSTSGVEGKVSFGSSNVIGGYTNVSADAGGTVLDINGLFSTGGARRGIFPASQTHSGVLASDVTAGTGTPNPAYPANAFGDGAEGMLELWINGAKIHEVDLSVFSSGSTLTSGSGFSLSASASVLFPAGEEFSLFKYRTGTWTVGATHQRNGHNFVQTIHRLGPTVRATNFFEWVVDADTTATVVSPSDEVLQNLIMLQQTPSAKQISGVEYHVSGTAEYNVQVQNLYRNTYSSSGSAVSFTTINCTVSAEALPNKTSHTDQLTLSQRAVVIPHTSQARILNDQILVSTLVDRTVQSDITSAGKNFTGILVDSFIDDATNEIENFNGEKYRLLSSHPMTQTSGYLSGGNMVGGWDSSIPLTSITSGYADGLLVYGGKLHYPNSAAVTNNGNFSTITNGPPNPNYSAVAGTRVFLRYFTFTNATANFKLRINASGTVVAKSTGPTVSTDQFCVELALPNTTDNGASLGTFKDAFVDYSNDLGVGIFAATFGNNKGNLSGADWGISFGGKNTGTSGGAAVIRITAPQGWTGNISDIQLVAAT